MARVRRMPMAEINVVPYIDVMLVLLIIFMITAPLLTQGVEVSLPSAEAKELPVSDQIPMVVSIDVDGRYYLSTMPSPRSAVDVETLMVRVAAELRRNPKRAVLVRGDKHVDYGRVVDAMAILQTAGAAQVGLMTEGLDNQG